MRNRFLKSLVSTMIVISIVVSVLSVSQRQSNVYAGTTRSGSEFTTDPELAAKLDAIFTGQATLFTKSDTGAKTLALNQTNKRTVNYYVGGDPNYLKQCHAYAVGVYYYLWGERVDCKNTSSYIHSNAYFKGDASVSYSKFVEKGVCTGSMIRTTANSNGSYNGNYGHTMIVLSYDNEGITVLENQALSSDADSYYRVQITYRTWAKFNSFNLSDKGRKICAVVVPDISYYNITPEQIISVNNADEMMAAIDKARTSSTKLIINQKADITINLADYVEKYPNLVGTASTTYTVYRIDSKYLPTFGSNSISDKEAITIANCSIKGSYKLSVAGTVIVNEDSSVLGIKPIDLKTSRNDTLTKNIYLSATGGIINHGYVNGCQAKYMMNYGQVSFAYNVVGLNNKGSINWAYICGGVNHGTITNWVMASDSSNVLINYGVIDTVMSQHDCYNACQKIGSDISSTNKALQVGGTIRENKTSYLNVLGGSVIAGNYTNKVAYDLSTYYVVYSITLNKLDWDRESGFKDCTPEQADAMSLFESQSHKSFDWYSPDGTGNRTYIFTRTSSSSSSMYYLDRLLRNITFAAIVYFDDYDFNIYENVKVDADLIADFALNLNGKTVTFDGDPIDLGNHSEFRNGTVKLLTSVNVKSPNTLIFDDVNLIVDDSVEGSPFICDNGHMVFEDCDNGGTAPIEVKLTTTTDCVEIRDSRVRTVGYVEGDDEFEGTADFIIRYGNATNGLTNVGDPTSQATTDMSIYSSLYNALNKSQEGEYRVLTDATIGDLVIPGDIVLTVGDNNTITVENTVTNDGVIGGSGIITGVTEDNVTNNGEIKEDVTIDYVPSDNPTDEPTPVPSTKDGVEGFCERLYTCALKRNSDPSGIATWVDELNSGRMNGAEVAAGFFFSKEFTNSNVSDEEFINRLYATFMNREPDEAGFNTWKDAINKGWTREQVFMGFVDSQEWANICYEYGIASGGAAIPDIKVTPSDEVIAFATRLYTTCLGRDGEDEGIKNWSEFLAEHKVTGTEAAHGFFFSNEFLVAEYSDEEFINRLYRTFMDREADQGGYETWSNALATGWTREQVFYGFANSNEFGDICTRYGIDR